jgi:hypothetical protein
LPARAPFPRKGLFEKLLEQHLEIRSADLTDDSPAASEPDLRSVARNCRDADLTMPAAARAGSSRQHLAAGALLEEALGSEVPEPGSGECSKLGLERRADVRAPTGFVPPTGRLT